MSDKNIITTEKLVEFLDQEASSLLHSIGVYDIGDYGWESEDTQDPNYIGHAMWQVNPPFQPEWEFLFDNVPVRQRPTDRQKLLAVAGNDFIGLMKASYLSMGLCLFHQSIAMQKLVDDNHYFWLHHTSSILQLNMASDRIREYFTIAFFNKNEEAYKKQKGGKGINYYLYTTPFLQARDHFQENQFSKNVTIALLPLPDMAYDIFTYRKIRNEIVHEISTKLGKNEKELVAKQQHAYDSPSIYTSNDTRFCLQDLPNSQNESNYEHVKMLLTASSILIEWYKVLAKFSSHIFEAEYWLRRN